MQSSSKGGTDMHFGIALLLPLILVVGLFFYALRKNPAGLHQTMNGMIRSAARGNRRISR